MARGGVASNADDIAYASGLASQTFNTEANRLAQLSGSQFGPGAAASILQTGMQGRIGSQNAALSALTFPFYGGNSTTPGTTTPNNTGMPRTVAPPPGTFGATPPPYGQGGGSLNGDPTAPYGRDQNGNPIDPNAGYGPGYGDYAPTYDPNTDSGFDMTNYNFNDSVGG